MFEVSCFCDSVVLFLLEQLPGQIDAFGAEAPVLQSSQQAQGYAALNEHLLSQLNYQLADSDKKVRLMLSFVLVWRLAGDAFIKPFIYTII